MKSTSWILTKILKEGCKEAVDVWQVYVAAG
jgi:hypothetical protein